VAGLVADLLMPLAALIGGKPDFSAVNFTVRGTVFKLGDFLNEVVAFLMIATAIYFFVVAPMNAFNERRKRGEVPPAPSTKKCPECLTEVPIAARRCAACTSLLLN
jgi:large conductance mechanosensitive channel